MASFADRISDTSTTVGTGALVLSGSAPPGYTSFYAAFNGNLANFNEETPPFVYLIKQGADYELGRGYISQVQMTTDSFATLERIVGEVIKSSNADALVNFPAGAKSIEIVSSSSVLPGFGAKVGYGTDDTPYLLGGLEGYGSGSIYYEVDIEPMGPGTTRTNSIWVCGSSGSAGLNWNRIWARSDKFYNVLDLATIPTSGSFNVLSEHPDIATYAYSLSQAAAFATYDSWGTLAPQTYVSGGTQQLIPFVATKVVKTEGGVSGASNNAYVNVRPGRGNIEGTLIVMDESDKTKFRIYEFKAAFICTQVGPSLGTGNCQIFSYTMTSLYDTGAGIFTASMNTGVVTNKNLQFIFGRSNAGTSAFSAVFDVTYWNTTQERAMNNSGV